MQNMKRHVFIISDGTGITAEGLAHSLMSQFEDIQFDTTTIPYVDNEDKALRALANINQSYQEHQQKPLIFATLVNVEIRDIIEQSEGLLYDLFHTFLSPMEKELRAKSSYTIGRSHAVVDKGHYNQRIDAVNYTLSHDDGVGVNGYDKADIILIGVSRTGKTPTCLYMALQFGLLAANYPMTEDDLSFSKLPKDLKPFRKKLFGLTIEAKRLHAIRSERRPDSRYASMTQCQEEVDDVQTMFKKERIPFLNTTHYSIEEIATRILAKAGIARRNI